MSKSLRIGISSLAMRSCNAKRIDGVCQLQLSLAYPTNKAITISIHSQKLCFWALLGLQLRRLRFMIQLWALEQRLKLEPGSNDPLSDLWCSERKCSTTFSFSSIFWRQVHKIGIFDFCFPPVRRTHRADRSRSAHGVPRLVERLISKVMNGEAGICRVVFVFQSCGGKNISGGFDEISRRKLGRRIAPT